jgi:AraC-like DNA-binding protein
VTVRATAAVTQRGTTHDAATLRGIFSALTPLGYDVNALIAPFGIDRSALEDKDACIASEVCEAVLAQLRAEGRVPNLPLKIAMNMPKGAQPLLDYLVASSETVGDSIDKLARFIQLVSPQTRLEIADHNDEVVVVMTAPLDAFRIELTTAISILRLRNETAGRLGTLQVCFRQQPDDVAEYEEVLGCEVISGASWNGWVFSREAWNVPMVHSDPALRTWLEKKAEQILAAQPEQFGVARQVSQALVALMPGGKLSIGSVARRLRTTPRTLQRRLSEQGTSYDTLRGLTQKQAAEIYLNNPQLSISEVAYLVGFSEPAAFHRAFKRWHNSTPQSFRRRDERQAV